MPDSSTHAAPEPSSEPDCTCTHITGDAYCPRHGEDAEPCPTPAEMTTPQRQADPAPIRDQYGIPTHGPGLPVEPEKQAPTRVGAREEPSASSEPIHVCDNYCRHGRARKAASTLPGLTVSADGHLLNWRGENYVRQNAPDSEAYQAGWRAGYAEGKQQGWAETMRPIGEPPTPPPA